MNEIWISDQESLDRLGSGWVNGQGSYDRPYYGDLDEVLRGTPAETAIHLLSGEFFTAGSRSTSHSTLKHGQQLLGAGKRQTKLTQVDEKRDASTEVLFSDDDAITIDGLTIDCAGDDDFKLRRVAVALYGSYSTIRNLRVINASGHWKDRENFTLYIGKPNKRANVIEYCDIEHMRGDYVNGLCVGGGEARIQSNTVELPRHTCNHGKAIPEGHFAGINLMHTTGVTVRDNVIYGGRSGLYNDTGVLKSCKLLDNQFHNTWMGVNIANQHSEVDDVTISGNTINLNPDNDWAEKCHGTGISFWNRNEGTGNLFRLIDVNSNLIRTTGNRPGEIRFIQLVGKEEKSIVGAKISYNWVEKESTARFVNATGVTMERNYDLDGAPYTG